MKFVSSHPWRVVVIFVVGTLLGGAVFYGYQFINTFQELAVEDFDPDAARDAIVESMPPPTERDLPPRGPVDPGIRFDFIEHDVPYFDEIAEVLPAAPSRPSNPRAQFPNAFGTPVPDSFFDAYLLIGVDDARADAIIMVLEPTGGGSPIMVSLPRDLWVWNECRSRFTRLNEGLLGCAGSASGPELLAIMVQDYTGIKVDRMARIDFQGFARLVDTMGGVTICVDHPTRDQNAHLDIPEPGCHEADGQTALAWVRSRNTQQLINNEWQVVAGSDFARQSRQQDVLFQLGSKAAQFSTPASLAQTLDAVSSSVRLSSSWTFGQAVSTGWRHRGISANSVRRFTVDARNYWTPAGQQVLVPNRTFTSQLSGVISLPSS